MADNQQPNSFWQNITSIFKSSAPTSNDPPVDQDKTENKEFDSKPVKSIPKEVVKKTRIKDSRKSSADKAEAAAKMDALKKSKSKELDRSNESTGSGVRVVGCWKKLRKYLKEYGEITEIHGLGYLVENRSPIEKIFWLIVILLSFAQCIYLIILVYKSSMHMPIIVSFSTTDTPIFEVPFPAVTFCPETKVDTSHFNFTKVHQQIGKNQSITEEEFKFYQYYYHICNAMFDKHIVKFNITFTDDFFVTLIESYADLDRVVYSCTFQAFEFEDKNCTANVTRIYTEYGICYSFNMLHWKHIFRENAVRYPGFFEPVSSGNDWKSETGYAENVENTYPLRAFSSGAYNALTLTFQEFKENVDDICTSGVQGFRVTIHDPVQPPDIMNYYIPVGSGTSVMAAVQPSLMSITDPVQSLSPKTRNCYLESERPLKFFKRYAQPNCLKECFANITLQICGCAGFFMPRDNESEICGEAKYPCIIKAKDIMDIMAFRDSRTGVFMEQLKNYPLCDCKPLCTELKYDVEVSVANWDFAGYYRSIHDMEDPPENLNLSMFTIYFKSDFFMKLQRTEFRGAADLVADIGGLLNLFSGITLLSGVEVAYFFTLRITCNKLIYGSWGGFQPNT